MRMSRRSALGALVACAATSIPGYAQISNGMVRIVSPYEPGGGTDILARLLAKQLGEHSKHSVIVDNRPGANGTIGSAYVARSAPDGQTLLIVPAGYAANSSLYAHLPYDPVRDLAPVSLMASGPLVLVVYPGLPVHNVRELIALAKAKPGVLNVGSAGRGSLPYLCAELFNMQAGVKIADIPYKGAGAAVTDLLSGQVPVYFMNILQSLPLIKAGKLRALGVTSPERSPIAPELPTISESGLPGFDMTNWYGLLVQGGTPKDTIQKLQVEIARILNMPAIREQLAGQGMTSVASTPERFATFLEAETTKYARIIRATGLKQD
jgi:tripartite-type tricarboxylate transporter receptor subunit TctC